MITSFICRLSLSRPNSDHLNIVSSYAKVMARSNANPKAHGKDCIRLAVFNLTTCIGRFHTRLQNIWSFFSKSVKKSVKRGVEPHTREKNVCPQSHSPFSASFQTFCLTARAYNTDCFAVSLPSHMRRVIFQRRRER